MSEGVTRLKKLGSFHVERLDTQFVRPVGLARYTVRGVAYWGVDDQVRLVDQYEAEIPADVVCKECWIGKKNQIEDGEQQHDGGHEAA